ncbi:hypothetical protein N866_04660 [Actinotalea ferrariae CF5-4]|uniref:Uncharacterized protein n=1 Tax=Actinotalea ferrariae CF5-4 TaxID=948458 RepID=A0A021VS68_9CELL|nr:hypothetical protein [Actinotalea ferrariae]EYR62870.1 hypothetical protein N866_04660 [Actinotalea ferrariae CF5-4]
MPEPSAERHRPWSTLLLSACALQLGVAVAGGTVLTVVQDAPFGAATALAMVAAAVPAALVVWVATGRRRADAGRPRTLREAALAGVVLATVAAILEAVSLAGVLAGVTTLGSAFGLGVLLLSVVVAGLAARTAAATAP